MRGATKRPDGCARRSLSTRRSPPSDEGGWRSRGKSLLIYGNRVKPRNEKYFAFAVGQIISTSLRYPVPLRGASAVVMTRGGDAVDVDVAIDGRG